MKNPGIEESIWQSLREKWGRWESDGHQVSVDFNPLTAPDDESNVLGVDVIQRKDEEIVLQTIQYTARKAYDVLNISGASLDLLMEAFEHHTRTLLSENDCKEAKVTMHYLSEESGEITVFGELYDNKGTSYIAASYLQYYALNAMRDLMFGVTGQAWKTAKVDVYFRYCEFYFEHQT